MKERELSSHYGAQPPQRIEVFKGGLSEPLKKDEPYELNPDEFEKRLRHRLSMCPEIAGEPVNILMKYIAPLLIRRDAWVRREVMDRITNFGEEGIDGKT